MFFLWYVWSLVKKVLVYNVYVKFLEYSKKNTLFCSNTFYVITKSVKSRSSHVMISLKFLKLSKWVWIIFWKSSLILNIVWFSWTINCCLIKGHAFIYVHTSSLKYSRVFLSLLYWLESAEWSKNLIPHGTLHSTTGHLCNWTFLSTQDRDLFNKIVTIVNNGIP